MSSVKQKAMDIMIDVAAAILTYLSVSSSASEVHVYYKKNVDS